MDVQTEVGPRRRHPIQPRRMEFPFDARIPKHWFAGSPLATHVVNGVNLLFPAGERFFMRSVRHYMEQIDDPVLLQQIKGFFGQEGRHAHEHERYFKYLEEQGYELGPFLERFEWFNFEFLEKVMPHALNLAATAAAEHFTAVMAENALKDGVLGEAHPMMQALLLWHACEEIEHKSVAFDVLQAVNPSYALRVAGLAFATINMTAWWFFATRMLLRQDGIDREQVKREAQAIGKDDRIVRRVFARGIREYLRRDFHPWDNDNLHLANAYLSSVGRST